MELLPSECWLNIFEYLQLEETTRVSLWISPLVTERLLDSSNQCFFRLLCAPYFKYELERAIEAINDISNVSVWIKKHGIKLKQHPNDFHISQLRENLRINLVKTKALFPNFFDKYFHEQINGTVKHSYSIDRIIDSDRWYYSSDTEFENQIEKMESAAQLKTDTFLSKVEEQAQKEAKRPTKWKSMWKDYYTQKIQNDIRDLTIELDQRVAAGKKLQKDTFLRYQKSLNKLFDLDPLIRRKLMFQTITVRSNKPNRKSAAGDSSLFFSKMIGIFFCFRKAIRSNSETLQWYENLIELFVQESTVYGVKTPLLANCKKFNHIWC